MRIKDIIKEDETHNIS